MPARRSAWSRTLPTLLAATLLSACGASTPAPTLLGVVLTPTDASLPRGGTTQLVAIGRFSDGTNAEVSGRATWTSTAPSVASVAGSGLVTGLSEGTAEITAVVEQWSVRATIAVGPAVPVGIEVTPTPVTVAKGQSAAFQAGQYVMSDGTRSPVLGAVSWSALPEAVATIDEAGLARSQAQGTATILAAQGALSGSATLTVGPPVLVSIAVSPPAATVFPGRPQRFTAVGTWTDGTATDVTTTATWTSSNPATFTMVGPLARSEGRGSAIVAATAGAVTGTATLQTLDARIAFTTSSHGPGNFSSWSYGVGKAGVQAADAICQSSARAGRLPGTYRALLSDAADDAYCRLHGLGGTKAGRCGQATLPATAGPWMRTDGRAHAARIDRMLEGEVYVPIGLDEFGAPVGAWVAFTGTRFDGSRSFGGGNVDCAGWTSATEPGYASGASAGTTSFAVGSTSIPCDQAGVLWCFEVADGDGPALPPEAAVGKLAFMTSLTGPGYLAAWADAGTATGIAAGDAICRARAGAAGFASPERFKAWLSDASTHARDRITTDGPWVRPDGVLVAADRSELLGGTLASSISMTETGRYVNWVPGVSLEWGWSTFAWTGTTQEGTAAPDHCLSWQAAAGASGAQGGTNGVFNWSHLLGMPPAPCSTPRALYCLED